MRRVRVRVAVVVAVSCVVAGSAHAALLFANGDYFTSFDQLHDTKTIHEYSPQGFGQVGSLTILTPSPYDDLEGVAFGPDGLMYAVVDPFDVSAGLTVLALDRFGNVHQRYSTTSYRATGNVFVDGQHIYVAAGVGLVRFDIGNPSSAQLIYSNRLGSVWDMSPEPNGNMFVAWEYGIDEISSNGTVLRSFPSVFTGGGTLSYTDIRGIAFDPATNDLYVSVLGTLGRHTQLWRVNASTGVLENSTIATNGWDIFLTLSQQVLVGSNSVAPQLFALGPFGLTSLRSVGSQQQMFVTQKTVPEPAALALVALAGLALALRRSHCS